VSESADKKLQHENAWKLLNAHLSIITTILSRPPAVSMQQHAEERGALPLLTDSMVPTQCNGHEWMVDWACSLLKRGADVNVRGADGYTPLQNWCDHSELMSAKGILAQLKAGADFDATNQNGWTALYLLCHHRRSQVLRELAAAGWLVMANIDLPGRHGETPSELLQRKLRKKPDDGDVKEMLELLSAQKHLWASDVRPAVLAQLGVHEQLVPEMAELIVSYMDGGKANAAAAAASS
jgi:hypothetical protein